jgi:hypothetical protein
MLKIYKFVFKIKKEEIIFALIAFFYIYLRSLFLEKFVNYYFLIFLLEIYLTICVYSGIKRSVFNEYFTFFEIFKDGFYYLPFILFYYITVGSSVSFIYLIVLSLINSIKIFSIVSFFLFFLILLWTSFPIFFLFLTLYTPFMIISENETTFNGIKCSVRFIRENLDNLVSLFFPFLIIWSFFFLIFQKYDKIIPLKMKVFLFFLISFIEIFTIKLVFLTIKGVKNERDV